MINKSTVILLCSLFWMQNIIHKIDNHSVENTTSMLTKLPILTALGDLINSYAVNTRETSRRTKDKLAFELHTVVKFSHWNTNFMNRTRRCWNYFVLSVDLLLHSCLLPFSKWMPDFLLLVSHASYGNRCISCSVL